MPDTDAHLQLVLFLCYTANLALSALLVWSGRSFPGAWFWVLAQGLLALGTLGDLLPRDLPLWISQVAGNTSYVAASILFLHSVWLFHFETRFPRWLYALIGVVALSFLVTLEQPYWVRSLVFSGWMTLGPLSTAVLLLRYGDRRLRPSLLLTAVPFLALSGASVLRAVLLAASALRGEPVAWGPANVWFVSGAILLATVILFGYFLMSGVRAEELAELKDEAIVARNRKLVESGRAKDLFFSIIAHDLRGPIGGAARYARKHLLGKMTVLEAKYTEVATLASALEKTNEFLEKLLWWSRAQLADWVPAAATVGVAGTLELALALVRPAADLKEIALEVGVAASLEVTADPESVQLVLANLLSNAVKFSLPGHRVRVDAAEENGLCRISVQDEGVGMDSATLDRLFRIEDKLTTHGTSGERGSGMGLLLSKSLAERNRGGITIDSEPGVGTKATLWLPTPGLGSPS